MLARYIGHSGFWIEGERNCLLLDYESGDLPHFPNDKRVYIFASHRHRDHFNPEIFQMEADHWILGRDFSLSPSFRRKFNIDDEQLLRCHRMAGRDYLSLDELEIQSLRSTDEGCAFFIRMEGKGIYHAGDLNQWVWRESEAFDRKMTADYLAEIALLKDRQIDAAFLPVDPRQGADFYLGADSFARIHHPTKLIPMHLWEDYDTIRRFKQHPCAEDYADSIVEIENRGASFEI